MHFPGYLSLPVDLHLSKYFLATGPRLSTIRYCVVTWSRRSTDGDTPVNDVTEKVIDFIIFRTGAKTSANGFAQSFQQSTCQSVDKCSELFMHDLAGYLDYVQCLTLTT